MGAVPKHRVSRHQRGNRRRHQRLKAPNIVICPNCGAFMQAHRVCRACGVYRGRQVIAQKERD
ncbi:MAG: 50S ribosomal protein L32 [Chloroflexaceae bacterium]|nr:50S ribosomal protein L32 [Chloroflexaceae bacterium]